MKKKKSTYQIKIIKNKFVFAVFINALPGFILIFQIEIP